MKYLFLLAFTCLTFSVHAQHYDFNAINPESVDLKKLERSIDSLRMISSLDSLESLRGFVKRRTFTPKYTSFFVGLETSVASLATINSELSGVGLNNMSENFTSLIFGFDVRGKRWLLGYQLTSAGKHSVSNNEWQITVRTGGANFDIGYDIVNRPRLQVYPQAGFGLSDYNIRIHQRASRNISDFAELLDNPAGTELRRTSFLFTYGIQAEYHLMYSTSSGGIILAFRYGLASDLFDGRFRINREKSAYSSSDRVRESFAQLVLKFYMKKD